jgi:hypothetical protein
VKEQAYCSNPGCQKQRKRRWHRKKLLDDPEYVQNRRDAQRRWREAHRDYWQGYRKTHPAYVEKNRQRQRERNRVRTGRSRSIAKIDASWGENHIIPGRYALVPLNAGTAARYLAHKVLLGGKPVTAQCAGLVLAYARRIFIRYYPCFTRFEAKVFLAEAFAFMDGVTDRVVIDNTSVIVACGSGPDAQIAPEMQAFSRTFGVCFVPL